MTVFSMLMRAMRIGLLFFVWCIPSWAGQASQLSLSWSRGDHGVKGLENVAAFLADTPTLKESTFGADVSIDQDELRYITQCDKGEKIDAPRIARACASLVCSQRFNSFEAVFEIVDNLLKIQWKLEGLWRFDRLKIHGLLVGKEWYAQLYQCDPGSAFNDGIHDMRLGRVVNALHDSGFFDAHVATRVDKNSRRKLCTVHLWPHKGQHYFFGNVRAIIDPYEQVSDEALSEIRAISDSFLKKRLEGARYSKTYLNTVATDLKRELSIRGFLQTRLVLQEKIRRVSKVVDVALTIKTGQCKRIVFFGNTFFPAQILFDRLLLFGQSVLLLPGSVLADEIVSMYKKSGFFDVKVDVVEEREALFFIITEGKRYRILPLQPAGVGEVAMSRVSRIVASFVSQQWFDADALVRMTDALNDWYARNGYLSATVLVNEPKVVGDGVLIDVSINEGECFHLADVSVVADGQAGQFDSLEKRLRSDIGKPMNPYLIDEQRRLIQGELRNQGYSQARISLESSKDSVLWRISNTLEKTRIGHVIISGTSTMPFKQLERLIKKQQGVVWRQDVFKNLFNEFRQTEVFSAINLDPVGSPKMLNRPLCLSLFDDDPFELKIRSGLALEHVTKHVSIAGLTYRVGGTLLIKNPFNRADTVRLEADIAGTQRTFELGYSQPWFLGRDVKYEGVAYSHHYDQPAFLGSKQTLYKMLQYGVLSSFHKKTGIWDTSIKFGFEWDKTALPDDSPETCSYVNAVAQALRFEPSMLGRGVPYIFIEPTLMLSTLDNALQPTKGSFSLLTLKGMAPVGGISLAESFVRFLVEQSFFAPLKKIVFALRLRFGHIVNKKFERIMPVERFFLGGANSVRGYETDFTPPIGCYVDEKGKRQYVPQGGRSMINANLEVRFPIIGSLGGVLFQDLGALHDSSVAYIKAVDGVGATGFGLRYQTPVGPLRFDGAWRWGSKSLPLRRFVWFLGFGSAF